MHRLFPVLIMILFSNALRVCAAPARDAHIPSLEGNYERAGVVDRVIEAQYKDMGLVLVQPVFIDTLLMCPGKDAHDDSEFIFRKHRADYIIFLPKAAASCALTSMGSLGETANGALLLRRPVTLTGEGSSPILGNQEDCFYKEKLGGNEWLVVATRIEWTQRSWFRSKKMEYRSVVRFREIKKI